MEYPEPLVSTSYLTTREDYLDFSLATARISRATVEDIHYMVVGIAIALFSALLLMINFSNMFSLIICSGAFLVGLAMSLFYSLVNNFIIRWNYDAVYRKNKECFLVQNLDFHENGLIIKTDRYDAAIPYDALYKSFEYQNVFIICISRSDFRFVPKRCIKEEENFKIREALISGMGDRFKML